MKTNVRSFWEKRYFGQAIIFALFLSFGVVSIMQSDTAYAEAHQSTITLGANIDTLSINLRPSVSGSFDKSADCIINVRTDNFTGYTLSIASASQDPDHATSLTDGNGNYIESITSNVSEADFKNSANTQYNNKWGYKPSQYIQSGTVIPNENYLPSPSLNGNLLDITSAANTVDNTYTITLGARIDSNIPAGAYSNDFIVYAIANDIVYNINYNKNTEDNVTNMPSPNPQVVTIEGGTPAAESYATLSNNTPTRTGYTFAGWCDSATTLDPNTGNQICSTTTYQPNTDYGIDQTAGPNVVLYAIWNLNTYNITIGTSTGISSINVTKDSTNICTASGPTASVCQLKYNMTYNIVATPNTGFSFNEWQNSTSRGSFGDVTQVTTTFTPGTGDTTLTATATANTYTVTLNNNGGSGGSSSTSVTYGATTLGTITNPTKANTTGTRTISGFSAGTGATDATIEYNSTQPSGSTCSAANNCKSTNSTSYTFNGWHDTSGTGTLVASSATTPALQANVSGYTNSSKQWTRTSDATLYAGWNASAGSYSSVTLPTIKKTGYTCHWNTNSSDTGTTYASGASVTPSSNLTLTGFCSVKSYTITFNGDSNISNFTVDGSTVAKGGTKSLVYGQTYAITINYNTGYTAAATPLQKSSGAGTVNGTNFTVGDGVATLYANSTASTYSVTLDRNCSTTATGSTSTTATYNSDTLAAITVPTCSNSTGTRTISGFSAGTGATDATVEYNSTQPSGSTCSAANNCKSTNSTSYTFNGWHDTSGTGTLVASNATTPALQANVSGYTNSSKQWTRTSDATLYAGWNASAGSYSSVTLPTIKKTGYTCHWNTNSSDTGTTYASGASVTPGSNLTLTGFCSVNKYNLVITGDSNVSAMSVKEGSTSGTSTSCTKSGTNFTCSSLTYGTKYYLYPSFASGYQFSSWTKTDSATNASLGSTTTENTYYQMGAGAGAVTLVSKATVVNLYSAVASMSKGTQTVADLRAEITTSNSGVYEYNSSVFGTASDAANTSKIYYYRGILDNTVGTYGSDGDNATWPNTVVLSSASSKSGLTTNDTCWRIVRTTGSGGVKMIYQGKWTGSTCANAQFDAQVDIEPFGLKGNSSQSAWWNNINRVGYTFNNTASIQDITTATSVDTVFGSNSSPSTNNARSNIKTYIEDTWYANNMTSYTSKLEASAGYCNDRTAFTNESGTSSMSTIPPYATSGATMYFGSYTRVANAASASVNRPSLTCPRSTVDLYRYVSGSNGTSNQLKYPAALLTADEAAFAGSGYSSSTTPYHANNFLRSGTNSLLLSPYYRYSNGGARIFFLHSNGYLYYGSVSNTYGVRPSISLTSGTMATGGTGTAADPWIVNP